MIQFEQVSKDYGKTIAIDRLTLELPAPGLYCLLGRNGAGKTTLLKLAAGHIAATGGQVLVEGKPAGPLNMPESVHFIQSGAAHFNMRLTELFRCAAQLGEDFDEELALRLAKRFELDAGRKYRQLSFGMKVMVNTVLALASGERVVIFDEPVLGFDALMRKTFYELLQESYTQNPKTIIVSTHLIDEIADVAQQLVIIDKGRLVLHSEVNELMEKAYSVTGPAEKVEQAVQGLNVLARQAAGGFVTASVFDQRIEGGEGYSVANLGMQDFFIGLVGGDRHE